jgi:aspartyl-tRNA(Asn)/glutamyl-tRNA(Gln) amidotransferase subunit C
MPDFTLETVKKTAHLARLLLSEEELITMHQKLAQTIDLVEKINQAPVDNLLPLAHPLDAELVERDDIAHPIASREAFQKIAPLTEAGLYLVPVVIE